MESDESVEEATLDVWVEGFLEFRRGESLGLPFEGLRSIPRDSSSPTSISLPVTRHSISLNFVMNHVVDGWSVPAAISRTQRSSNSAVFPVRTRYASISYGLPEYPGTMLCHAS